MTKITNRGGGEQNRKRKKISKNKTKQMKPIIDSWDLVSPRFHLVTSSLGILGEFPSWEANSQ